MKFYNINTIKRLGLKYNCTFKKITKTVREIFGANGKDMVGFIANGDPIMAMNGMLCIHPSFQRGYIHVFSEVWCQRIIETLLIGRPMNPLYFGVSDYGVRYETIDGQQRLYTIGSFLRNEFKVMVNGQMCDFRHLSEEDQNTILNYTFDIYECSGTEEEKMEFFKVLNQESCILLAQEIRNASCTGEFIEALKKEYSYPSKKCKKITGDGVNPEHIYYVGNYKSFVKDKGLDRCAGLEMVLEWVTYVLCHSNETIDTSLNSVLTAKKNYGYDCDENSESGDRILDYMKNHRYNVDAVEEVNLIYHSIVDWINDLFFHNVKKNERVYSCMHSEQWARLWVTYGRRDYTEEQKIHFTKVKEEMFDNIAKYKEMSDYSGVIEYILRNEILGEEKPESEKQKEEVAFINRRGFSDIDKKQMLKEQGGVDIFTGKPLSLKEAQGHHIKPFHMGGYTVYNNLLMVSEETHRNIEAGLHGTPEDIVAKRDEIRRANGYKVVC